MVTETPKPEALDPAVKTPADQGESPDSGAEVPAETAPSFYMNPDFDFAALAESTDQKDVKDLCEYFGALSPVTTNEYTGLFKDYNLIMICAESFSTYGIHPDLTPTLWDMAGNGIVLDNFYNSFPNTTTNGEFSFVAGLWPDVSRSAKLGSSVGSFAQSAARYMPYAPGVLFEKAGYDTYAYHNYKGYYYRRKYTYPNLGYRNLKFMDEGMKFTTSWPSSDLEMFEQSVDDYLKNDKPFHAYYMTFSGHGPYTDANCIYRQNIDEVTAMTEGLYKVSYTLGYYCGELELERAVTYLKKRLEEEGKLDKTVIVIVGDHYPYYLMKGAVREIVGGTMPDENFEKFKSTCIVYCGGIKEPIHVDEYCCNVDILPTLYNLFDIPFDSRLLPGTDVFSDGVHCARLYNGSFLTKFLKYDKPHGKVYYLDDYGSDEVMPENYLETMQDYTESKYAASLTMMETDFFRLLYENSGYLTPEEAEAELARQEKTKKQLESGR
ncbi:MAG: LTA synthase family protein [Lachnospiraceae bacterium]|nr:LTA synthase family protein [Lachnospiraceae bacterium]